MVRPERFELPACCSGGNRSIQLSYGRAWLFTVYMGKGNGFNIKAAQTAQTGSRRRLMQDKGSCRMHDARAPQLATTDLAVPAWKINLPEDAAWRGSVKFSCEKFC
jgi:hypothetical protein